MSEEKAIKKGAVGKYEYWLAGPNKWEVRKEGNVLSVFRNLSDAARECRELRQADQGRG